MMKRSSADPLNDPRVRSALRQDERIIWGAGMPLRLPTVIGYGLSFALFNLVAVPSIVWWILSEAPAFTDVTGTAIDWTLVIAVGLCLVLAALSIVFVVNGWREVQRGWSDLYVLTDRRFLCWMSRKRVGARPVEVILSEVCDVRVIGNDAGRAALEFDRRHIPTARRNKKTEVVDCPRAVADEVSQLARALIT